MTTLSLLRKLVSIDSTFPREQEISNYIKLYLKQKGYKVDTVKTGNNRNNIIATYGKTDRYLGFYGHMDTVPNNFTERKSPFDLKINGNIAIGLGVEDMKGGIAAILKAGEFAVDNEIPLKLIFGCDEENISQGAHDLVNSGKLSDIGFLISAESGQIPKNARNFTTCFGRKGRILFSAKIEGKKSHAAEQEKGINAIYEATKFLNLLKDMKFSRHKDLGNTDIVVHSFISETDSFSIPDNAEILFSLLTVPGTTSKEFLSSLKQLIKKNNINMVVSSVERETPYGESYEIDKKNLFLQKLQKNIFEKYNVIPMYTASVADENIFAHKLKIPVISLGPLGGCGHTSDEWLDLASLKTVESVYKQIISLYNSR